MKRFDERDILFARMNYSPGSLEYEDYYRRHPELKEVEVLCGQCRPWENQEAPPIIVKNGCCF